jgi:integrase
MRLEWDGKHFDPANYIPAQYKAKKFHMLAEQYIRLYKRESKSGAKSVGTFKKINQRFRDYLLPAFSDMDIREIKFEHIEKLYLFLLDKGLATKTVRDILTTLKAFLSRYRDDVIKIPKFTVVPKKQKAWMSIDTQLKVYPYIPKRHGYALAIELLHLTGCRPGEIIALQKRDLVDGCIHIHKTISEGKLKLSRKSGGIVTHRMALDIWQRLIEHTKNLSYNDFVFNINGRHLSSHRLYKVWRKALKDAEIEQYIPLYQSARHSKASQIKQEYELKGLQEAAKTLGHNNTSTTETYVLNVTEMLLGDNDV